MKRRHSSLGAAGAETCIALIDSRFLAWLQGQADGGQPQTRQQLYSLLSNALAHSGLDVNLRRIYWYGDSVDDQAVDGQIARLVQAHGQDGGLSMLRALGGDLQRLAERGACEHLLVGSDDERLIGLIDEAQLHGVSVHLLVDEAARNISQLQRDDPGRARLLMQAGRRVVLGAFSMRDGASPRHGSGLVHQAPVLDPQMLREQLNSVIQAWWAEEPEDLREDLREELQNTRGIPQEVDRQLLLGVRRVLERALSFQEKKLLREMVREVVLGRPEGAMAHEAQSEHID